MKGTLLGMFLLVTFVAFAQALASKRSTKPLRRDEFQRLDEDNYRKYAFRKYLLNRNKVNYDLNDNQEIDINPEHLTARTKGFLRLFKTRIDSLFTQYGIDSNDKLYHERSDLFLNEKNEEVMGEDNEQEQNNEIINEERETGNDDDNSEWNNSENLEENNGDRKDNEFGILDYLVINKESDEVPNQAMYKKAGAIKYNDGAFIPDDYFDNSDYEA